MRLFLVSTPRSGNTWFRNMIAEILDLEQIAVHGLAELPQHLSENVILQIHSYPTRSTIDFINRNNFKVLVITRHPLDVLISVLHFAQHEPDVSKWLDGHTNAEILTGYTPIDVVFINYIMGEGARTLLGVNKAWLEYGDCVITKYEKLTQEPFLTLTDVLSQITSKSFTNEDIWNVIKNNEIDKLSNTPNHHGWIGKPDNWIRYITKSNAKKIFNQNSEIFTAFNYDIRAAKRLSKRKILKVWEKAKK